MKSMPPDTKYKYQKTPKILIVAIAGLLIWLGQPPTIQKASTFTLIIWDTVTKGWRSGEEPC